MVRGYQGRAISVETDFVMDMKKRNYRWGAAAIVVLWSVAAGAGLAARWDALVQVFVTGTFAIVALYVYAISVRLGPMVVYEHGLEYSAGVLRRFDPWDRLMWAWEDQDGLTLRRVHGIEAAMGLLDNRSEVVKLVVVPFDMPDYQRVVDYIIRALREAHGARGTKWRWDRPRRYR